MNCAVTVAQYCLLIGLLGLGPYTTQATTPTCGNEIILEPLLGYSFVLDDFLIAYTQDDKICLPLGEISDVANFNISVDLANRKASGFSFSEDRTFFLDIDENIATTHNKQYSFQKNQLFIQPAENDIFIDSTLPEDWFDIQFIFDPLQQTLRLLSDTPFPAEERQRRQQNYQRLAGQQRPTSTSFLPLQATPYQAFSLPEVQLNLANHYRTQEASIGLSSTMQLYGDLAYLNGELALAYTKGQTDPFSARLRLGRKDAEGTLLGPMGATAVVLGDISVPAFSLLTTGTSGRGVAISSLPLRRGRRFGTKEIRGPTLPGYDAELYRNNRLIDFRTVGDEAEFRFKEVELLFGRNTFIVELYGPEGQRDSLELTEIVGQTPARQGQWLYQIAAVEKNQQTLLHKANSSLLANNLYAASEILYGLTDQVTLSTAIATIPVENQARYILGNTAAAISWGPSLVNLVAAFDQDGDPAYRATLRTQLIQTTLSGAYEHFSKDYTSDTPTTRSNPLRYTANVRVNRAIRLHENLSPISLSLQNKLKQYTDHRRDLQSRARLSTFFFNTHWLAELQSTHQRTHTSDPATAVNGTLRASHHTGPWRIVSNLSYVLQPTREWSKFGLSTTYRNQRYAFNARTTYTPNTHHLLSTASITQRRQHLDLNINASYDNQTHVFDLYAGINIKLNLGYNPPKKRYTLNKRSNHTRGSVLPRIFLDKDNDGLFSADDRLLKNIGVRIGERRRISAKQIQAGPINNISPYERVNIAIDKATLTEPFMTPSSDGFSVKTRPGVISPIDLALVNSGEIEGFVLIHEGDAPRPAPNLTVALTHCHNDQVTLETTYHDGSYFFENIRPGCYTIQPVVKQLDALGYTTTHQKVQMPVQGGSVVVPNIAIVKQTHH